MRWIAAIGLAGVALAGCEPTTNEDALTDETATAEQNQIAPTPDDTAAQPEDDAADPSGQADGDSSGGDNQAEDGQSDDRNDGTGNELPPAGSGLRFVGLWASSAADCENLAWQFTARRLETPAGSVCTFDEVTKVGGGYDIAATCTAEGPPTEDRLEIRFAESARAMLFESDSIADAGLVYCGPNG